MEGGSTDYYENIAKRGLHHRLPANERTYFDQLVKRGMVSAPLSTEEVMNKAVAEASKTYADNPDILEKISAALPTVFTSIASEIGGGLAGAGKTVTDGAEAGVETIDAIKDRYTMRPNRTGAEALQEFSEIPPIAAMAKLQEGAERTLGDAGNSVAGPVGGAIGTAIPTAIESFIGTKYGQSAVDAAGNFAADAAKKGVSVAADAGRAAKNLPNRAKMLSPNRRAAAQGFGRENDVASTVGWRLDENNNVVPHEAEQAAVKNELPDSTIGISRSANNEDGIQIRRMLDDSERRLRSGSARNSRLPSHVVGERIQARLKTVWGANRSAAKKIDAAAQSLRGKPIDVKEPVENFLAALSNREVKFDKTTGQLDFQDSDFEGLGDAQKPIKKLIKRMYRTKNPDAYDAHRLKKYIDNVVTYGNSPSGLKGDAANILKDLRHDLDLVLDGNFPEYDQANLLYSNTRSVIDQLQDVAGKKTNLLKKGGANKMGALTRRFFSNAESRDAVIDAVDNLDFMAKDLAGGPYPVPLKDAGKNPSFNDSLTNLAEAAMDIELHILDPQKSAFKGMISQAIKDVPTAGPVVAMGKKLAEKTSPMTERRKRTEARFEKLAAMRGLFSENQL